MPTTTKKPTGKIIRLKADTWQRLARLARPFEDSPDDVIRRMLDERKPKVKA